MATKSPAAPGRKNYCKAILSSADNHILRCDLAPREGKQRGGLCVDDFGPIFDVLPPR